MADNPPPEEQNLDSVKQALASKRREPTELTEEQITLLTAAFERNAYPGIREMEELAARLNITEFRVHIWFQNRRARQKLKRASSASTCSSEQMGEENPSPSESQ